MIRYTAMMLGALLLIGSPALANDKPNTVKQKTEKQQTEKSKKRKQKHADKAGKEKLGKAYTIDFKRPYKTGQRFLVTGSASRTIRALQPRGKKKRRKANTATAADAKDAADTKEKKGRRKGRKSRMKGAMRTAIALRGELEIVKVNKMGDPTQVRLTVHTFKGSETKLKGSSASTEALLLRKGDVVLIGRSGKNDPKFTVKNRDLKVPAKIADLFDGIVPIDDTKERDKQLEDLLTGKQKRRVGETWKLEAKQLPKMLQNAEKVSAMAKFAGVKTVGKDKKTKCFDIRVMIKARNIAIDGKAPDSMVSAKAMALFPVDSQSPPLKASASFTFRGKHKGDKARDKQKGDATATSARKDKQRSKGDRKSRKSRDKSRKMMGRFELTHKYQREIRPLD